MWLASITVLSEGVSLRMTEDAGADSVAATTTVRMTHDRTNITVYFSSLSWLFISTMIQVRGTLLSTYGVGVYSE